VTALHQTSKVPGDRGKKGALGTAALGPQRENSKESQGGGNYEASQKSTATCQNRSWEEEDRGPSIYSVGLYIGLAAGILPTCSCIGTCCMETSKGLAQTLHFPFLQRDLPLTKNQHA
jgi:hypothetical protein